MWGEPSGEWKNQLYFNNNLVVLDVAKTTWFDFDNNEGGSLHDLMRRRTATTKEAVIPEFPLIDIGAWIGKTPPETDWAVENRVPIGVITGLYGDGGVGKTILLLQLAVCIVLGIDWFGAKIPVAGRVLIMCCEDDERRLWQRVEKIADYYGTDIATLKERGFNISTFAGKDATIAYAEKDLIRLTPIFQSLYQKAQEIRPRFIGIDNLADVFAGNEIIRTQVREFMTKLNGVALGLNNAIALTAHPSLGGMSSGKVRQALLVGITPCGRACTSALRNQIKMATRPIRIIASWKS